MNEPEVVAYHHVNKASPELRGVSLSHDQSCTSTLVITEELIRLADYERLQAETERLQADHEADKARIAELEAELERSLAFINNQKLRTRTAGGMTRLIDDLSDAMRAVQRMESILARRDKEAK